jgi:hypothetical protein
VVYQSKQCCRRRVCYRREGCRGASWEALESLRHLAHERSNGHCRPDFRNREETCVNEVCQVWLHLFQGRYSSQRTSSYEPVIIISDTRPLPQWDHSFRMNFGAVKRLAWNSIADHVSLLFHMLISKANM